MPAPAAERRRDGADHPDNPEASATNSLDSLLDEVANRKEVRRHCSVRIPPCAGRCQGQQKCRQAMLGWGSMLLSTKDLQSQLWLTDLSLSETLLTPKQGS